jgi:non-ribosomal peptide synthetase-like protein
MARMSAPKHRGQCLQRLFEAHAERRPSAPAIVSAQGTLTYAEVNGRANQLARHLRRQGVRTGQLVGLYLERSPDALVGILSILKAGAAYVPLDPAHPTDRIRHIMDEAGISTLVSETPLKVDAHRLTRRVVEVDDPRRPWRDESTASLPDEDLLLTDAHLSYVLYTSGSTGRPKGVMTEHRNVVSFVAAFNQVIRLTRQDRVFHGFSPGFDGSVEEMWMAFSNGAALVVPRRGPQLVGNELACAITGGRATVFSTVPTSLSMISDPLPTVRLLIVSGERCSPEIVRRWATRGRRMLNVYGPTETTVNATAAECRPDAAVTIGRPLEGYELYILDEEGRPVAAGATGELFIAGPGVARGYLNQPDLTRTHFVPWPEGGSSDRRAYRTGDLVSLAESGELLFVGRADNQVKLRGYRIELSEIEAVLGEHASIRSAVVTLPHGDQADGLAAYVVPREPARGVDRDGVLALLSSRLPAYMIPASLDVVPAFPTLASGKVDRKRLPPPATPLLRSGRTIRGPRDALEADVLGAFTRTFKNDAISIDDDFFLTLGGYSLLAVRLVSHLRSEFGFDVAIRDVYEHPTVLSLSAHLTVRGADRPRPNRSTSSGVQHVLSRHVFGGVSRLTRTGCVALQTVALYLIFGVLALPYLSWFLPFKAWEAGSLPLSGCLGLWLLGSACAWPFFLLLSVAVKWTVIGRFKPGAYPVWGWYYLRWWVVSRFQLLAFPGLAAGTPLLPLYYRLMGAKVGKNCTLDTTKCTIFDLLQIGEDTSIGVETQILGYRVEDGCLLIGSIDIGNRCFVGIHSSLGLDTTMADDSRLDDLSHLPDGATLSRGECARGSPAGRGNVAVPEPAFHVPSSRPRALYGLLHVVVLYALGVALLPALAPSAAIMWLAQRSGSTFWLALSLPVAGIAGMVAFCLWVALLKRIILSRVRPGVYRVESPLYLRKWAVDLLMGASRTIAKPLYTTIYLPAWLRLLGAKIGRRAEISTVSQFSPELMDLGEQSFFADGSMIGGRRLYRGLIELRVSRVGRRSFVGNSAILPVGTHLGDNCLLGCLSRPPDGTKQTPDGTEWLGSPSFALPHRQKVEGFDERLTHEPTPKLIAQRLLVDAVRIALPSVVSAVQFAAFVALVEYASERLSPGAVLLAMPAAVIATAALGLACVVAIKKVLVGTFHPVVKPLWSMFVWLNEVVNGAYETIASPLLTPLLGTPYCAPWLRLLGCKIGRHVYLETTLFSEFDLVHVGDYAALNAGAVIQNHLFEDRIMKASFVRVGDDCCVGNMAVVLYDTEMQPGSSIGPLSLLMKGETLAPRTQWLGIPTAQVQAPAGVRASAAPSLVQEATLAEGWP